MADFNTRTYFLVFQPHTCSLKKLKQMTVKKNSWEFICSSKVQYLVPLLMISKQQIGHMLTYMNSSPMPH